MPSTSAALHRATRSAWTRSTAALLEVAVEALENGGYSTQRETAEIGVGIFAGCSLNTYLLHNLCADRDTVERLTAQYQVGEFATAFGNDKTSSPAVSPTS